MEQWTVFYNCNGLGMCSTVKGTREQALRVTRMLGFKPYACKQGATTCYTDADVKAFRAEQGENQ